MTMGEKIQRTRQAKGLTQRQVAGDRITRNMLSKIENGSATPSLKTLEYIAQKLGMPTNYFLGDGSNKMGDRPGVDGARSSYRRGDCKRTLEQLEHAESNEPDRVDEIAALRALACTGLARENYRAGELSTARAYAREALKHNAQSLYYMGDVVVECNQLIMLCAVRSTNASAIADGREAAKALWQEEQRGGIAERTELIERFWFAERLERLHRPPHDEPSDAWSRAMRHYLNGRDLMNAGNGKDALNELKLAIDDAQNDGSRVLLNDVYAALENAAREQEDFRSAYEYAAKRLMLQEEE